MKTKILICVAFFIVLTTAARTFPQGVHAIEGMKAVKAIDPVFTSIHAHREARGVMVTWTTSATEAYVNGFSLIRTYEDPLDPYAEWQEVGSAACTSSRSYRCGEDNVSPGFVSYRVVASMVGGGLVFSDVETIHIIQH